MTLVFKPAQTVAPELRPLLTEVINAHHPHLPDLGVGVGVLMVWDTGTIVDGKPRAQALKHGGYFCAATIQKVPKKWAALLPFRALMIVDWFVWLRAGERRRRALLDHELTHLDVVRPDTEDEEPKVRLRSHDLQIGGFKDVAARWGVDALEVVQVVDALTGDPEQPWLPGFDLEPSKAPTELAGLLKGATDGP